MTYEDATDGDGTSSDTRLSFQDLYDLATDPDLQLP
jgi:hypothetical protein